MKVEKVAENKIRITLTIDELKERKITLKDIENDELLARDLFLDLIEESNIGSDFIVEGTQLFIEASSDNNNLFVLTITKVEDIPELASYSTPLKKKNRNNNLKNNKKNKNLKDNSANYKVASNIYSFNNMDAVLKMCDILKRNNYFLGKNSLYKSDREYFIIFSESSVKNKKFLNTFSVLSEYCKSYQSYSLLNFAIREKYQLIIENNALQKLTKI